MRNAEPRIEFDDWSPGAGLFLADHTDTILRQLSTDYFARAWSRASSFAKAEGLSDDFTWGELHSGVAVLPFRMDSPLDHLGFLSKTLDGWSEPVLAQLEARAVVLSQGAPPLRAGRSYGARSFHVAASDADFGVRLVEASLLEAVHEWLVPGFHEIESPDAPQPHVGRTLALAIERGIEVGIHEALELAAQHFTPAGLSVTRKAVARILEERSVDAARVFGAGS